MAHQRFIEITQDGPSLVEFGAHGVPVTPGLIERIEVNSSDAEWDELKEALQTYGSDSDKFKARVKKLAKERK